MQFKSLSHAKVLLALCLVTASTSVHFGMKWSAQVASQDSSLKSARANTEKSKSAFDSLSQSLQPDAKVLSLDSALAAVMLEAFNRRVEHGVSVASANPAKVGGGSMNQLSTLAEDVPNSSLKSVKVNLTGTYETYPGLMAYLTDLQKLPVAVVRLKVQEQSFEASLRVYGPLNP